MKVLIYRGDKQHLERELGSQPLRIGRNDDNDIVLEDPGKGVSRHHAEIRPENGGYTLVDLGSQNGIWVHGSRVPSVRLEPGVAVAVGPYRLTVPEQAIASAPPPQVPDFSVEPTEFARGVDARSVNGAGGILDPMVDTGPIEPLAPSAPTAPPPPVPTQAERAAGSSTVKPAARAGSSTVRPAPAAKPGGAKVNVAALTAVALLVVIVAAVGGYELMLHNRKPKPVWSREEALALVNQHRCPEAMQQQIGPALAANPSDADALALKAQCEPPPAPPAAPTPAPPPPPPDPTAQALDAVDASLANLTAKTQPEQLKECQSQLEAVNTVLTTAPDNARAHDLQTKVQDCIKAATPVVRAAAPAGTKAIPPAQGGLDVKQGETQQAYDRRVSDVRKQYDDAIAQVQAQHYSQAKSAFDALAPQVPAGYLDLAQRRSDLQKTIRDEAARQYAQGQQAEQKGDFVAALRFYQRSHDLDPSHDVNADIARANETRMRLGHEACDSGDSYFLLGHNSEATVQYNKVINLLPDTDPCFVRAKQRLAGR